MAVKAWLRPMLRVSAVALAVPLLSAAVCYARWEFVGCRLVTITQGSVYQSAAIPSDDIVAVMQANGMRTVIDLRDERPRLTAAEQKAVTDAGLHHVHLPMPQYVDASHAAAFLDVMKQVPRPVLVHCHHGQGRSVMMCAVHRIENEGWSNEAAFEACVRLPDSLRFLNDICPPLRRFRREHRKGRFVLGYVPR